MNVYTKLDGTKPLQNYATKPAAGRGNAKVTSEAIGTLNAMTFVACTKCRDRTFFRTGLHSETLRGWAQCGDLHYCPRCAPPAGATKLGPLPASHDKPATNKPRPEAKGERKAALAAFLTAHPKATYHQIRIALPGEWSTTMVGTYRRELSREGAIAPVGRHQGKAITLRGSRKGGAK